MDGTVGARLREERERLRMSQEQLASVGDIRKLTQIQYEKDSTSPTAKYLSAVAAVGVDVLYVLTGQCSEEIETNTGFDVQLLAQVVEGVELLLTKRRKTLSAAKKAQVIVMLYRSFSAHNQIDEDTISQMIELAA